MNVFDYLALREKPYCVVVKYTQSHVTHDQKFGAMKFNRVKAAL